MGRRFGVLASGFALIATTLGRWRWGGSCARPPHRPPGRPLVAARARHASGKPGLEADAFVANAPWPATGGVRAGCIAPSCQRGRPSARFDQSARGPPGAPTHAGDGHRLGLEHARWTGPNAWPRCLGARRTGHPSAASPALATPRRGRPNTATSTGATRRPRAGRATRRPRARHASEPPRPAANAPAPATGCRPRPSAPTPPSRAVGFASEPTRRAPRPTNAPLAWRATPRPRASGTRRASTPRPSGPRRPNPWGPSRAP